MPTISPVRHLSVFNPIQNNKIPIHIIGMGATGSRIFQGLIELGLTNIKCYDFDIVEEHNLANQIYWKKQVGLPKVEAAKEYYKLKTGENAPPEMIFHFQKVNIANFPITQFKGIVFLLTDTMASRKEIMDDFLMPNDVTLVIETRMASSYGDIRLINPKDPHQVTDWYNSLIHDDDAEMSPCGTSISMGATASIIASMAIWQMIHVLTDPLAQDPIINLHLKPLTLSRTEVQYNAK